MGPAVEAECCMNELYINVGSKKCCLFVKMSILLLRALERTPLLYFAVEEALECAKTGYYGIGILTFSQLLNLFNERTPASRHVVAHELLRQRPTKLMFEEAIEAFKSAASRQGDRECRRHASTTDYQQKVAKEWKAFFEKLNETYGGRLQEAP
jgi:hypothetical protein